MRTLKTIILTSIICFQSITLASEIQNEPASNKENIGFGLGALVGGVLAGPVGVVIGAGGGTWLGDRENESDKTIAALEKELNAKSIEVVTNGSIKKANWWAELALKANVVFSIDGLEDTNHIYRVGAQWDKIMANAEAFIAAGGNATWQYIVFRWNAHQEEDV